MPKQRIVVAEVLFELTREFLCPPNQESNHKLEPREVPEAKSVTGIGSWHEK